jgi:hypothetical protein|tara:strand:+ start:7379 stop:8203 length:825 start_codon:yes stop_codon:yes gene_type:complete
MKHNKKRNTAFIYECLIREATVAIIKNDTSRQQKVVNVIKKHFAPTSVLSEHLQCYKSLYETTNLPQHLIEKVLKESKLASRMIDPNGVFQKQTELIHDVNTELGPETFNNFVPNYKTLATIDQIFNIKTSPKKRVMLENQLVNIMSESKDINENTEQIDSIALSTFVHKFNEKYSDNLLEEQKTLLNHYIASFTDNALQLKIFLNDEISRLKNEMKSSVKEQVIAEDPEMKQKALRVVEKLEGFKDSSINDSVLLTVLKAQQIVKEINDGSNH